MKVDYEIAIPSYGRFECRTARLFPEAVIYCHEGQAAQYAKANPDVKLSLIPDGHGRGNMAIIRNWIIDHSSTDRVLMLDDDISEIGLFYHGQHVLMDVSDLTEMIGDGFDLCEQAGTVLWGINQQNDPKFYREYTPFSLLSVVLGPFFGLIKNAIRFDESLGMKEDYDYSIQVLNKYRRIFRMNKYYYLCGHIAQKNGGGLIGVRTYKKENDQAEALQHKWGSGIVTIERKTQGGHRTINPLIHVPIPGI